MPCTATSSKKAAPETCQFRATGACQRQEYTLRFTFDSSRRESGHVCLRCDSSGFVPIGPLPAINLLIRR